MFHHMSVAETGTQAIDRAAELLVSVVESDRPLAVGELAAGSGLPKSTTSRLVGALERKGLVQRAGDRRVLPGPVLLRFAHRDAGASLVELPGAGRAVVPPRRRGGEPRRARGAGAEGAGGALGRDGEPRRRDTARRRAPRAGGLTTFRRRHELGRAPRPVRDDRERQGAEGVRDARPRRPRDPRKRLRDNGRRARARPIGARGAGARRRRPSSRRALHLRPDDPPHPRPHRRARARAHRAGAPRLGAARQPRPARCRMTHEEILKGLYDETLIGNAPEVKDLVNKGLEEGLGPEAMLYDALIPSLEEVGARFERGDYFVPEMLIAARAMQGALDILRPLLAETGAKPVGRFLMGTVKGDVHDIGKNLCNIMLEGAGFTVIDLGVNVPPEKFVEQIKEHEPDIVGFSAFLTTTMPMFKANINALEKAGIRNKVAVMVGGAPVTQEYADAVGADGYSADASSAVKKAKELVARQRGAVPA